MQLVFSKKMPRNEHASESKPRRSTSTKSNRGRAKGLTPPKPKAKSLVADEKETRSLSKKRENNIQRRFRPTEKALSQIRKYKKVTQLNIRRLPFQRLVREIAQKINPDVGIRWTQKSLEILQSVSEDYIISLLEDAYQCTLHAKRITLMCKDISLARRIRGITDPGHATFSFF